MTGGASRVKVFGTGLPRTGTTSLAAALRQLGLHTRDLPFELLHDLDHEVIRSHDAFTDNPIPSLYRELDRRHPGARFVHTVRDEASWLRSVRWLFTVGAVKFRWDRQPVVHELHRALYGRTTFDETAFLEVYRRHEREVREHFAGRPGDLLILDLFAGDAFEKLAPFLGHPVPAEPFPHRNRRASRLRVVLGSAKRKLFPRR